MNALQRLKDVSYDKHNFSTQRYILVRSACVCLCLSYTELGCGGRVMNALQGLKDVSYDKHDFSTQRCILVRSAWVCV